MHPGTVVFGGIHLFNLFSLHLLFTDSKSLLPEELQEPGGKMPWKLYNVIRDDNQKKSAYELMDMTNFFSFGPPGSLAGSVHMVNSKVRVF